MFFYFLYLFLAINHKISSLHFYEIINRRDFLKTAAATLTLPSLPSVLLKGDISPHQKYLQFLAKYKENITHLYTKWKEEARSNLEHGDLVFMRSDTEQAPVIEIAQNNPLTHSGIITTSDPCTNNPYNEPHVLQAVTPVNEDETIDYWKKEHSKDGRILVMRIVNESREKIDKIVEAARTHIGKEYDDLFLSTQIEMYCSELQYLAAQAVGIEIGTRQPLASINWGPEVTQLFYDRYNIPQKKQILLGAVLKSPDPIFSAKILRLDQLSKILEDPVILPARIAQDLSKLKIVYSDFSIQEIMQGYPF